MFSICNLKRGIRCAALCSDFLYTSVLSYRQRTCMCVCYAVYSNLYLVILGFDDKFSQSSRFCWGSNFSSLFKFRTSQSYLIPDFKKKLTYPGYFRLCPVIESPFLAGVVWRVHWGQIVYESETGDYFKVSVGDILDNGRNDHEPGLVTKVNTALPPVREWRAVIA